MRVILFQRQFVEPLLSGRKKTTIRKGDAAGAAKRWPVGSVVSLRFWSGSPYHSPQVEFAQAEIGGVDFVRLNIPTRGFYFNGRPIISDSFLNIHAQLDGFRNFSELVVWFEQTHGLVDFYGVRAQFRNIRETEGWRDFAGVGNVAK